MAERSEPVRSILFAHEPHIRLAAYLGVFAGMAAWELILPRRKQVVGPGRRLPNNLGVVALDTLLVRILFPTTAVGLAMLAEAHGFGLFNIAELPAWIGVLASVVLLRGEVGRYPLRHREQ